MRSVDAGVQDGDRRGAADGNRAEEVRPADLGKRPLIGERGVGGLGLDRARSVGFYASDFTEGSKGGELVGGGGFVEQDRAHRQLRDRADIRDAGILEDLELPGLGGAADEGNHIGDRSRLRRLDRLGCSLGRYGGRLGGRRGGSLGRLGGRRGGSLSRLRHGCRCLGGLRCRLSRWFGRDFGSGRLGRCRLRGVRRIHGKGRGRSEDIGDEDQKLEQNERGAARATVGTRQHSDQFPQNDSGNKKARQKDCPRSVLIGRRNSIRGGTEPGTDSRLRTRRNRGGQGFPGSRYGGPDPYLAP